MPDSEPIPGGPTAVWMGPADALAFFETVGMGYLAPVASLLDWRVVDIPTLCAAPPPIADEFTMIDIAQGIIPGQAGTVRDKLHNWVDRALWANHCQYTDATPAPTIDPQPSIPGFPEGPTPEFGTDRMIRDIHEWSKWTARQIIPRSYHAGSGSLVSGQGEITFTRDETGEWPTWPAGVNIGISERPDWAGRSNGGDFPVFYDLGWISLARTPLAQPPIRLQHDSMVIYGSIPEVRSFYYNLAPGVSITVSPLYPDTSVHIAE